MRRIIMLGCFFVGIFSAFSQAFEYVPGDIIVKTKAPLSISIFQDRFQKDPILGKIDIYTCNFLGRPQILKALGMATEREANIYVMKCLNPEKTLDYIQELEASPLVEWAQPNHIYRPQLSPNDTFYNDHQVQYAATVKLPEAWDVSTGTASVVIAIIDSGAQLDHEDLSSKIWQNTDEIANDNIDNDNNGYVDDTQGWDFFSNDKDPSDTVGNNVRGHGTHVAGIAGAASNNGKGITGAGFNSTLMIIRAGDTNAGFTDTSIADSIDYARVNGAHIINMSFGGSVQKGSSSEQSIKIKIDAAEAQNILMVAAAGNDRVDVGNANVIPAAFDNVITVAAGTHSGLFDEDYSNQGNAIDILAPGTNILSTVIPQGNSRYQFATGTSMASPMVAGIAGLMLAYNPAITPTGIKNAIYASATDQGATGKDVLYGHGLINAQKALSLIDPNPPTGSHTAVTENVPGKLIAISGTFTDDFPLSTLPTATVHYRYINALSTGNLLTVTMNKSGSSYTAAIPTPNTDITTVNYYISVADNGGNTIHFPNTAPTSAHSIHIGDVYPPTLTFPNILDGDFFSSKNGVTAKVVDNYGVSENTIAVRITSTQGTQTVSISSSLLQYNSTTGLLNIDTSNLSLPVDEDVTFNILAKDISNFESSASVTIRQSTHFSVTSTRTSLDKIMNNPNPFNPDWEETAIIYQLSQDATVKLYIYSLYGDLVYVKEKSVSAGYHDTDMWNGRDQSGRRVPNGVYLLFLRAEANGTVITKRSKIAVIR